ncbi:hypothetical protein NIES2111_28530 [Nostoc sp. NIES-2111]|nr:hypothetical protein NIES2111_28530 [Nostoc sp. NIES-2111]
MELISGFIDTYLRLNATEEQALDTELKQANLVEEEAIMEIVTSWMEKGEQKIVKRQVKRRFNNIDSTLENRIDSLSVEQIENLADAIFDFQSLEDLNNWLDQQN